jgi:antitoxin Phd
MLVPIAEWRRLNNAARPSLKALLLSDVGRAEIEIPQRTVARRLSP